jgi:hypothetical protein
MKTITKRLCRLEGVVAGSQSQGPTPAEILRERKRRLGLTCTVTAPATDACGNPLSVVEILRAGRRGQRHANQGQNR